MDTNREEYKDHLIFEELVVYYEFYKDISFTTMGHVTTGVASVVNIDTYIFSSMQGTIDSIRILLLKGRINDAYALLRKYYDSVIINVYLNLYLQTERSLDNFFVEKINNWLNGREQLPEYRIMSDYIKKSTLVKEVTDLLYKDELYKNLRNRCNDHTHYNFYHNVLLNDNEIFLPNRIKLLNQFSVDIRNIFILHCSYMFYLNDYYMASTDYVDCLDAELTPDVDSLYYVAPFIQDTFDKTIKKHRIDLCKVIIEKTSMKLT